MREDLWVRLKLDEDRNYFIFIKSPMGLATFNRRSNISQVGCAVRANGNLLATN